jgi:hypothetical protein
VALQCPARPRRMVRLHRMAGSVTEREALSDLALAVARLNLTKCNCIRWDAKRTAMDALEQALRVLTPPEPEYPWAQLDDTEMARRDGWAVE